MVYKLLLIFVSKILEHGLIIPYFSKTEFKLSNNTFLKSLLVGVFPVSFLDQNLVKRMDTSLNLNVVY